MIGSTQWSSSDNELSPQNGAWTYGSNRATDLNPTNAHRGDCSGPRARGCSARRPVGYRYRPWATGSGPAATRLRRPVSVPSWSRKRPKPTASDRQLKTQLKGLFVGTPQLTRYPLRTLPRWGSRVRVPSSAPRDTDSDQRKRDPQGLLQATFSASTPTKHQRNLAGTGSGSAIARRGSAAQRSAVPAR